MPRSPAACQPVIVVADRLPATVRPGRRSPRRARGVRSATAASMVASSLFAWCGGPGGANGPSGAMSAATSACSSAVSNRGARDLRSALARTRAPRAGDRIELVRDHRATRWILRSSIRGDAAHPLVRARGENRGHAPMAPRLGCRRFDADRLRRAVPRSVRRDGASGRSAARPERTKPRRSCRTRSRRVRALGTRRCACGVCAYRRREPCRDALRRRRVAAALTLGRGQDATEPTGDLLHDRSAALPARQRAVLVLRFYEDLPNDEVARLLKTRPGTVKSLVHRGLAALREVIEQ